MTYPFRPYDVATTPANLRQLINIATPPAKLRQVTIGVAFDGNVDSQHTATLLHLKNRENG